MSNINTTTSTNVYDGSDVKETINTEHIGDFVTDVEFSSWMQAKRLTVVVFGLRPNTLFYPYFDQIDVSAYCTLAEHDATKEEQVINTKRGIINWGPDNIGVSGTNLYKKMPWSTSKAIYATMPKGSPLRSSATGELKFFFDIPEKMFKVGDRKLEVFDATPYVSRDSASSYASKFYSAYSLRYNTDDVTVTTRTLEITETIVNESEVPVPDSEDKVKVKNERGGRSSIKTYKDENGTYTYVRRDSDGNITSVSSETANGDRDYVQGSDPKAEPKAEKAKETRVNTGGCFLTTAIVEMRGEADDGPTLTKLRNFRDTYMRPLEDEIIHYYDVAPKIVSSIPKDHSDWIWIGQQIDLAVESIDENDLPKAHEVYKNMVLKLERDWIKGY